MGRGAPIEYRIERQHGSIFDNEPRHIVCRMSVTLSNISSEELKYKVELNTSQKYIKAEPEKGSEEPIEQ